MNKRYDKIHHVKVKAGTNNLLHTAAMDEAECAAALALDALALSALINFEMRLGEGSGAALIVPLLQSAIALHNEMATFESAAVTDQDG